MAIRRKATPAPEGKISMTSMIDVVFLLIIFFMVVTEMQKMEIEELTLPTAYKGKDEKEDPKQRLIINLIPVPDHPNRHKRCRIVIQRQDYSLPALRTLLRNRTVLAPTSQPQPDVAVTSELFVKIRADAQTEYQYIVEIMAQCAHVGIYRLSFAVWDAKGGF